MTISYTIKQNALMDEIMPKFLSLKEVSEVLKLNINTVRRYVREDKIQAAKFGRIYRVREEALEEFIKKQEKIWTEVPKEKSN